jgi:alpha-ribazole phosphatase
MWCVRHAPVDAAGICYGQYDVPTRIDAREAASIARASLGDAHVDVVYASPWARSGDVAKVIAEALRVPLVVDPRIAEIAMGEWEGRAFAEIEKNDAVRFARWMSHWETESPPGGETVAAFRARVDAFVEEARAHASSTRLLVTHAGVVRAIRARVSRIAFADALASKVEHLVAERFPLF